MQPMSALGALITRGALRTRVTLGTPRARLPRVALRSLCPRCAVIPAVAFRTLRADRTPAVLHVAGAVVVDVLDGEVTRPVPIQIPAMQALGARRKLGS